MDFSALETEVWQQLAAEARPLILYGMGNGADKILDELAGRGRACDGLFASDEFVRDKSFRGLKLQRLSEIVDRFGEDIVILVAFGSHLPEMMDKIEQLDRRFSLFLPDVPVVAGELFTREFARAHQEELTAAYALLADDASKSVFLDIVRYKLSGKLRYLRRSQSDKDEVFRGILRPSAAEHFADLGAYNGDTIRELLGYTGGKFASITALEPDRRSFGKLSAYAAQLSGEVLLENAGAWSEDTVLPFSQQAGRQSCVQKEGKPQQMRALDSVLHGRPCTLLKFDVEGAEAEALMGAATTIKTHRPKINLAAYHHSRDLFALPLLLHQINPDYRIYLRRHPCFPAWEVNYYAV